jgi:hypothetical protein
MNIYKITWEYDKEFNLSAVVVAASEDEALKELDLELAVTSNINFRLIGKAIKEITEPCIILQESL